MMIEVWPIDDDPRLPQEVVANELGLNAIVESRILDGHLGCTKVFPIGFLAMTLKRSYIYISLNISLKNLKRVGLAFLTKSLQVTELGSKSTIQKPSAFKTSEHNRQQKK